MADYKVKGSHVVMAAHWVDERLGAGTFKGLVANADPEYQSILLPVAWYNVDPLAQALQKVAVQLAKPLADIAMEIARQNALKDLTSIYRIFLKIAAPVRVMSFTPRLWSTYVRFGEATAIQNEPGHYIGECTGIPQRLLDWSGGAWRGFVPTAIELAGGKGATGVIIGTWPTGQGDLYRLQCEVKYR